MSNVKVESFLPLPPLPSSDDESKKSPIPMKNKVAMYASQLAHSTGPGSNISPVPTRGSMKTKYGQLLTPGPGRLTPTGQGRIKAPPVCVAPALKRVASSMDEFNTAGVCFPLGEAEMCAEKAQQFEGGDENSDKSEETPLNIEQCDAGFTWESTAEPAGVGATLDWNKAPHHFVSSSSTVVTTSSSSSCGRSSTGSDMSVVASMAVNMEPPLKVVRTDLAVSADDDQAVGGGSVSLAQPSQDGSASVKTPKLPSSVAANSAVLDTSTKFLSATFTNNLIKGNSSRQGRSLQRWLIHSPTDELVRQVAGTIPITRDGRIILVSASRKIEWILPKGGWDTNETKKECAARETFEEAGLLGRLGGCLEPIDYETNKAKKRRLSKMTGGEGGGSEDAVEGRKRAGGEGSLPPLHKRAKTGDLASKSPTGLDLPSSSLEKTGSVCSSVNPVSAAHPPSTEAVMTPAAITSFDPKKYSYVRLSLFPLFVSSVKSDWPENGRLRKLVDIDEAIQIMEAENRPYFKRGLEMVKERGLHLLMKG